MASKTMSIYFIALFFANYSIGGGELFDRVIEDEFVLTEKACAAFMRQIVEAVAYIHKQHIIHLDLKVRVRSPVEHRFKFLR